MERSPGDPALWSALAAELGASPNLDISPRLLAELNVCLDFPEFATPKVVHLTNSLLLRLSVVTALLNTQDGLRFTGFAAALARGELAQLSQPPFPNLLAADQLPYPETERFLSILRRHLLDTAADGASWPGALDFLCALALQCFLTDYAYLETAEETARVDRLMKAAAKSVRLGREPRPEVVALIAAYRPLSGVSFAKNPQRLKALGANPMGARLLATQVDEPRTERQLRKQLPSLTAIRDRISAAVRAQYEENPYPRWRRVRTETPTPVNGYLATALPRASRPLPVLPDRAEILVAGCGTGRQPIETALALPDCRITAIDLSLASLAYAKRKADALKIANLSFAQADILELGAWDRRFDLILSSGVLHHLRDPAAGLKVLRGLLREPGIMKVALYSERARHAVVAAQAFIAAGGYAADANGIRAARRDLLALPLDHPAQPITETRDFYTLSTCRDLLFHVQEHRFTPLGLRDDLDGAGLAFLGFQGLSAEADAAYRTRFPDDPAMTDLENWETFEAEFPETFLGMYQAWAAPQ